MQPLDIFLPQPAFDLPPEKCADFDALVSLLQKGS
jgi:hypothetical protein